MAEISRLFILLILFFSPFLIFSQNKSFEEIDQQMLAIPGSMEKSSDLIAQFINKEFDNEADKIRAVFIWTAQNISFDIKRLYKTNKNIGKKELIEKTLSQRKAVCEGYATLFNDLATKVGIKSYIINGYTKQNGTVDNYGHAWCIAKIDSEWFVFDPTWGAGHILNSTRYIKAINNDYFKADPQDMIISHMPIDPLWQLLDYPISNQEFYDGKTEIDSTKIFFNYKDSIASYERQNNLEQFISSSRRIKKREIKNKIIENHLEYLRIEIEYFHNRYNVDKFNLAIDNYNLGVSHYNEFIIYRSKEFKPKKTKGEIQNMLNRAIQSLKLAKKQLNISNPKKQLENSIREAQEQIDELLLNCNEQQKFLDQYFKTQSKKH